MTKTLEAFIEMTTSRIPRLSHTSRYSMQEATIPSGVLPY